MAVALGSVEVDRQDRAELGARGVQQAEPVALEPAQMAHMIVYPVPTEPLAIGVLLTSAPWTMR